jgi:hypothetical protein
MPSFVTSDSAYSQQFIPAAQASIGELFAFYQHDVDHEEEAVLGLLCIGMKHREIGNRLRLHPDIVKQVERRGINHMIYLYRTGK